MSAILPCLMQLTLFPMQFYITNGTNSTTYNAVSPHECQDICLNNSDCGGFNYDGQHLQCITILTDTFYLPNLVQNNAYGTGFYMKSYSECFTEAHTTYIFIVLIVGLIILIGVPMVCYSNTRTRNQTILFSRRPSGYPPLINEQEAVPPPYQSTEETTTIQVDEN